jgi:hypothetical protein
LLGFGQPLQGELERALGLVRVASGVVSDRERVPTVRALAPVLFEVRRGLRGERDSAADVYPNRTLRVRRS